MKIPFRFFAFLALCSNRLDVALVLFLMSMAFDDEPHRRAVHPVPPHTKPRT